MSNSFSICRKCHKVIIQRNYSSTWKIPSNPGKETEIHEPIDILFYFSFDARKFHKELVTEYWRLESIKRTDYYSLWSTAIDSTIKKWKTNQTVF